MEGSEVERGGSSPDDTSQLARNRSFKTKQLVRSQAIRESQSPPRILSPLPAPESSNEKTVTIATICTDNSQNNNVKSTCIEEDDNSECSQIKDFFIDSQQAFHDSCSDVIVKSDRVSSDRMSSDVGVISESVSSQVDNYRDINVRERTGQVRTQQVEIQITPGTWEGDQPSEQRQRTRRWLGGGRQNSSDSDFLSNNPRTWCVCGCCKNRSLADDRRTRICPDCRGRRRKPACPSKQDSGIVCSDECPDCSDSNDVSNDDSEQGARHKRIESQEHDNEQQNYCRCHERRERNKNYASLTRTDSDERTDPSGSDLVGFIKDTLNKNARDRSTLLKIERELLSLINDTGRCVVRFPVMTSYGRMLVHRCAQLFGLSHHVDQVNNKSVLVSKSGTSGGRVPCTGFRAWCAASLPSHTEAKSILKRSAHSLDEASNNNSCAGAVRSKSLEQREEEYERVRRRIFSTEDCPSADDSQWPWLSGQVKLLTPDNSGKKLIKVHSLESSSGPSSSRTPVSKSHSFGGYGPKEPREPRILSRQGDLASSSWRLSPSSSGYKTLSLRSTDSVTPSPTGGVSPEPPDSNHENALVWAVTDLSSIPIGAVIIHPQTGRALTNPDGTLYHYDPTHPPLISGEIPPQSNIDPQKENKNSEKRRGRLEKQNSFIDNEPEYQTQEYRQQKCQTCCQTDWQHHDNVNTCHNNCQTRNRQLLTGKPPVTDKGTSPLTEKNIKIQNKATSPRIPDSNSEPSEVSTNRNAERTDVNSNLTDSNFKNYKTSKGVSRQASNDSPQCQEFDASVILTQAAVPCQYRNPDEVSVQPQTVSTPNFDQEANIPLTLHQKTPPLHYQEMRPQLPIGNVIFSSFNQSIGYPYNNYSRMEQLPQPVYAHHVTETEKQSPSPQIETQIPLNIDAHTFSYNSQADHQNMHNSGYITPNPNLLNQNPNFAPTNPNYGTFISNTGFLPGQIMTNQGPLLSSSGHILSSPSHIVTGQGPLITNQGHLVTGQNPLLTGQAPMLTGQGPLLTGQGHLVTGQSPLMTGQSPLLTSQGHLVTNQGHVLTSHNMSCAGTCGIDPMTGIFHCLAPQRGFGVTYGQALEQPTLVPASYPIGSVFQHTLPHCQYTPQQWPNWQPTLIPTPQIPSNCTTPIQKPTTPPLYPEIPITYHPQLNYQKDINFTNQVYLQYPFGYTNIYGVPQMIPQYPICTPIYPVLDKDVRRSSIRSFESCNSKMKLSRQLSNSSRTTPLETARTHEITVTEMSNDMSKFVPYQPDQDDNKLSNDDSKNTYKTDFVNAKLTDKNGVFDRRKNDDLAENSGLATKIAEINSRIAKTCIDDKNMSYQGNKSHAYPSEKCQLQPEKCQSYQATESQSYLEKSHTYQNDKTHSQTYQATKSQSYPVDQAQNYHVTENTQPYQTEKTHVYQTDKRLPAEKTQSYQTVEKSQSYQKNDRNSSYQDIRKFQRQTSGNSILGNYNPHFNRNFGPNQQNDESHLSPAAQAIVNSLRHMQSKNTYSNFHQENKTHPNIPPHLRPTKSFDNRLERNYHRKQNYQEHANSTRNAQKNDQNQIKNDQDRPHSGQNRPNSGLSRPDLRQESAQNMPELGQNRPNSGQNMPELGQTRPNSGQNMPEFGQPLPNRPTLSRQSSESDRVRPEMSSPHRPDSGRGQKEARDICFGQNRNLPFPYSTPFVIRQMSAGPWCRRSPGPMQQVFQPRPPLRRPPPDTRHFKR